jgi:peptidyl-prolyl cis-trans isomerase A (cyclophilin A)
MSPLLEEIVAIRLQRFTGVGLFLGAVAFGMHVAGQTTPPAGAPSAEAAGAAVTPSLPAGQNTPDLQTLQKMLGGTTNGVGSPTGAVPNSTVPDKLPAFGPAAQKLADDPGGMSAQQAAPPKDSKPTKFIPSEIETYSSKKVVQSDPRAVLHTSMGDIRIRLYAAYAPKTVHNFIDLVRGDREFLDSKTGKPIRRPFYNDLIFHRVIQGFLVQTGCPFGNGHGGPGFNIADEITPALRFSRPGMVAMAPERKDPTNEKRDSNGSQFFISLAPMPSWDDKFTIFGEIEKGMKVLEKIARVQTGPTDRPIKRVFLNSIEVFENPASNETSRAPENNEPQ